MLRRSGEVALPRGGKDRSKTHRAKNLSNRRNRCFLPACYKLIDDEYFKAEVELGDNKKKSFLIYPLSKQVSATLKETMRDQFRNEPKIEQAQSRRSICRRCLRRFNPGERRLLFKYRPFEMEGVFAEAGSIYIHDRRTQVERLP
jgi:Protein of unknown function (DUF1203)